MKGTAAVVAMCFASGWFVGGCKGGTKADVKAEAPPATTIEHEQDVNVLHVEHPEQFPVTSAVAYESTARLMATGIVNPDISRSVPVVSLAAGRVVDIHARLGDTVKQGQVLLRVQSSDMSNAFSDYRKAVADEQLARTQLERSQLLYGKGAVSLNDLQVVEDTEAKAKVDVENATERIRILGGTTDHPAAIVDIRAPVSGVITDQQITTAGGVAGLGSSNPFTISDLSYVWVVCDVYENDLGNVHIGENAEFRLNAYPDLVFTGRISNVGSVLDPSLRTAKVRIETHNPGLMRVGMFVTATFRAQRKEKHAAVPLSAVLHLHDREWVYVPSAANNFRRVEVLTGETLSKNMLEVVSGIQAGQQVVTNALTLQSSTEQ